MRIAICDDEQVYRNAVDELLRQNIQGMGEIHWDSFCNGEVLLRSCSEGISYDIAFLDIEMPGTTGLKVAESLLKYNPDVIIFFITSHVNYVSQTFRLQAFQFLLKPIDPDVFREDFKRATQTYLAKHKDYIVQWRGQQTRLEYKDIIYIETFGKHIVIHTKEDSYECVGKISEEAERLKKYGFVQCHQSFVVNATHIRTIRKEGLVLTTGKELMTSRTRKKEVVKAFHRNLVGCV